MNEYKVGDFVSLYNMRGLWRIIEIWKSGLFNHYKVSRNFCQDLWITDTDISGGRK